MTRIAVVGAHGKVGQHVLRLAVERGDEAVGIIRNQEHAAELEGIGARARIVDIESASAEELAQALADVEAVVFAAGAGSGSSAERKRTVDYGGSVLTVHAARIAGVQRIVQLSGIGTDDPVADDADFVWKTYVEAKRQADVELRASGLDWTIVRPGALVDHAGTGRILLADRVSMGEVPRADVAAVILEAIHDDRTIGKQWEFVSGDRPIREAFDAALAG